ncbi:hypothetical protein Tco_0006989 [Tanacetum coccineum]
MFAEIRVAKWSVSGFLDAVILSFSLLVTQLMVLSGCGVLWVGWIGQDEESGWGWGVCGVSRLVWYVSLGMVIGGEVCGVWRGVADPMSLWWEIRRGRESVSCIGLLGWGERDVTSEERVKDRHVTWWWSLCRTSDCGVLWLVGRDVLDWHLDCGERERERIDDSDRRVCEGAGMVHGVCMGGDLGGFRDGNFCLIDSSLRMYHRVALTLYLIATEGIVQEIEMGRVGGGGVLSFFVEELEEVGGGLEMGRQIIIPVPDSSQHCAVCGTPVDGPYCHGCTLIRKKFEKDLFTYCVDNGVFQNLQDTSESSNDNTNVVNAPREPSVVDQDPGVDIPQDPPQIDHNCCYECGDSLNGIFCQKCICDSVWKKVASCSYNCPPKDPIIPRAEPVQ